RLPPLQRHLQHHRQLPQQPVPRIQEEQLPVRHRHHLHAALDEKHSSANQNGRAPIQGHGRFLPLGTTCRLLRRSRKNLFHWIGQFLVGVLQQQAHLPHLRIG